MISHSTLKVVLMLMMAAVFMNLINYIFCIYYYSTEKGQPATAMRRVIEPRPLALPSSTSDPDESVPSIESDTSIYFDGRSENTSAGRTATNVNYLEYIDKDKPCPEIPPGLGPISFNTTKEFIMQITNSESMVVLGGQNKITRCVPNEKAAVIVPISPSSTVPMEFINHMHAFLRKQLLEYQLFIVQQSTGIYNRGLLFNAAVEEIHKRMHKRTFSCFVFHEPSIVPVDTRNIYRCSWYPRQLVTLPSNDANGKQEESTFGGAIALTHEQFIKANGFSNSDDCFGDMAKRLLKANYAIERVSPIIGQFITVVDNSFTAQINVSEMDQAQTDSPSSPLDDLDSLLPSVISFELRDSFTYMLLNLTR